MSATVTEIPDAPALAFASFLFRAAEWSVLVWGCALPLMVATWASTPPAGRVGELCGVALWTLAVIWCAERLRRDGADRASCMLQAGTVALLVLQGVAAMFRSALVFFLAYSPAVWLVAQLSLLPDAAPFHAHLLLTLACGAQAFGGAWLLGWLMVKVRRAPWTN